MQQNSEHCQEIPTQSLMFAILFSVVWQSGKLAYDIYKPPNKVDKKVCLFQKLASFYSFLILQRKETGRDFAWDKPVGTWACCMIASFAGSLIANPLLGKHSGPF